MKIVPFSGTLPALKAGQKTCTRRQWHEVYASRFHSGDRVAVYDRSPAAGGRSIGLIELTGEPYRQAYREAPPEDWVNEGFAYLESAGVKIKGRTPGELWKSWLNNNNTCWVVRFKVAEVFPDN